VATDGEDEEEGEGEGREEGERLLEELFAPL